MRGIIFLFLLLLLMSPTTAQEDEPSTYALRLPRPDEYLEAVPLALQDWEATFPGSKTPYHLMGNTILTEFYRRYPRSYGPKSISIIFNQSFDRLSGAFHAFQQVRSPYGYVLSTNEWAEVLLMAWLREHPGGLEVVDRLQIEGLDVGVREWIDFNGDGIDELVISLHLFSMFENVVLQRDEFRPEGYRIAGRFLWEDYSLPHFIQPNQSLEGIRDITGDGLPEIIIRSYRFYSNASHADYDLSILHWERGFIRDVMRDPSWGWHSNGNDGNEFALRFTNLDSDAALEIELTQISVDVWECPASSRRVYDWRDGFYKAQQFPEQIPDSLACALRQAEPLMWEHEFEAAIPFYEHGLSLTPKTYDLDYLSAELNWRVYARARLALAYDLAGRTADAQRVIAAFPVMTSSAPIPRLLRGLRNQTTAMGRCLAAYQVFENIEEATQLEIPVGYSEDQYDSLSIVWDDGPPPEMAGCDVPWLIASTLEKQTFSTTVSLPEQFKVLTLQIDLIMPLDLDEDGNQEWLVWMMGDSLPIYFIPYGNVYRWSRPDLPRPGDDLKLGVERLPGSDEPILYMWHFGDRTLFTRDQLRVRFDETRGCVRDSTSHLGSLTLWRLSEGLLEVVENLPLCEPVTPDQIFKADGLYLWRTWLPELPTIYRWDAVLQRLVMDPMPGAIASDSPPLDPPAMMTDGVFYDQLAFIAQHSYGRDNELTLQRLDDLIIGANPLINPLFTDAAHYWRALTLEKMGRIDEALAEYVYLVENSPDFAWGRLAALHVIRQ